MTVVLGNVVARLLSPIPAILSLSFLLLCAACSGSGITVKPPEAGTLREKGIPYIADLFLVVDIVEVKQRTPEVTAIIERRRGVLTDQVSQAQYAADIVRVKPLKYLIPSGSRMSYTQRGPGEFRFDPASLAKGEEGLRELLDTEMEMLIDYAGDDKPVAGTRGVLTITTIPGAPNPAAQPITVVSWVGKEWLPKLKSLTFDAAHPADVEVPFGR